MSIFSRPAPALFCNVWEPGNEATCTCFMNALDTCMQLVCYIDVFVPQTSKNNHSLIKLSNLYLSFRSKFSFVPHTTCIHSHYCLFLYLVLKLGLRAHSYSHSSILSACFSSTVSFLLYSWKSILHCTHIPSVSSTLENIIVRLW